MGIKHVGWIPGFGGNPPEKITYQFGDTKEISNSNLMWQVRICKEPGKVEVIAAFKEPEDAVSFMTLISKNGDYGIVHEERIVTGMGKDGITYSIEHNSSSDYVELEYKKEIK
jgi:hypothetical protein